MKQPFNPKVSIVIPVYNGSNYLREAIDSALGQTYKNIEIIVINDGSNDKGKTDEICKSYGNKIRYFKKENGGVSSALNLGIEKMEGEYFSWLSHDDVYYPNKIEEQIKLLDTLDNKNTILYSNVEYIDEDSETIYKTGYEEKYSVEALSNGVFAVFYGYTNGCSMLIPKKCFEETGGFNEELKTANDYEMWFRLFKKYPVRFTPQTLIRYRFHNNQGTKVTPEESRIEESEKVWIRAIKGLDIDEVESFGVEPVKFYYDLAKRMKEAGQEKTYKLVMKRAKEYYEENGPVISVIIPCYNQGKYIDEAVDSVLSQTYQNFEIIIVDDGSTDNYTKGLLENFKKPKTKVYRTENKGASSARNYGFRKANGEYIQFLDADDFLDSKKFEKQIEVFQNDKVLDIVYSNYKYYLDKEKIFFEHKKYNPGMDVKITKDIYEDFLFGWQRTLSIPIHSPLFRKNLWDKGLPFVEGFGVGEDWIMWINLAKNGAQMFFLDEELAFYRLHQKSMTHNKSYLIYWVSRSISYIADNLVKEEYKGRFDKESEQYLNNLINNLFVSESMKELDLYKKKVEQYEKSFSWRITKPLRILGAILRKFLQILKNKNKFKFNKEQKYA